MDCACVLFYSRSTGSNADRAEVRELTSVFSHSFYPICLPEVDVRSLDLPSDLKLIAD